jgi:hypothetical protein
MLNRLRSEFAFWPNAYGMKATLLTIVYAFHGIDTCQKYTLIDCGCSTKFRNDFTALCIPRFIYTLYTTYTTAIFRNYPFFRQKNVQAIHLTWISFCVQGQRNNIETFVIYTSINWSFITWYTLRGVMADKSKFFNDLFLEMQMATTLSYSLQEEDIGFFRLPLVMHWYGWF